MLQSGTDVAKSNGISLRLLKNNPKTTGPRILGGFMTIKEYFSGQTYIKVENQDHPANRTDHE
jgi:hypothetical protein